MRNPHLGFRLKIDFFDLDRLRDVESILSFEAKVEETIKIDHEGKGEGTQNDHVVTWTT